MSMDSDISRCPSLSEFSGWYNLGYERDDGVAVLNTDPWVPEFEHAEFFELFCQEREWFDQLVPPENLLPYDPLSGPPFFFISDADDRTVRVETNFDYLTPELLDRIQLEFLGRHPWWRVILITYDISCAIVIYPEMIRFGDMPAEIDAEEALRILIPRAAARRERAQRGRRAQLKYIQSRLPSAVREIGSRPFHVFGLLDSYNGDPEQLTLLLLIQGSEDEAITLSGFEHGKEVKLGYAVRYGVDEEGIIVSDVSVPESAAYCAREIVFPSRFRGPLTIVDDKTGRRETYVVSSENLQSAGSF